MPAEIHTFLSTILSGILNSNPREIISENNNKSICQDLAGHVRAVNKQAARGMLLGRPDHVVSRLDEMLPQPSMTAQIRLAHFRVGQEFTPAAGKPHLP